MCFLFSDDEFSATALLSEESRIKNTYTDGAKLRRCIKYICPNRCIIRECTESIIHHRESFFHTYVKFLCGVYILHLLPRNNM